MANKKITGRDIDFAKWYNDVVANAHLSKYSNVKGCIILEPNGYAIWEKIQQSLDKMFKESGHKNVARRRTNRRFCPRSSMGNNGRKQTFGRKNVHKTHKRNLVFRLFFRCNKFIQRFTAKIQSVVLGYEVGKRNQTVFKKPRILVARGSHNS